MDLYESIKSIGNGMFGQVFLAKHKLEDKYYALKRINFRDLNQKDKENIENEVQVLKELKHPNIVSYKDSFFDSEDYFNIVMVYCDGGDFYNKIKNSKGKHFSESEIIDWIVQLGLALSYIHDKKILHRDLKTQNIFIKENKIRIGDFGISKIFNQTRDLAGSMVGTPLYMSPEQYSSKKYGFKSDIWAFGCCLYEMCNMKHAFEGLTWNAVALKVIKGTHQPVNSIFSKDLRNLIDLMLSVNPKNRPTISTILEKPFIKKRVATYIYDFIQINRLDGDDLQCSILQEQAEKLGVFNIILKELNPLENLKQEIGNNTLDNKSENVNSYSQYLKNKNEEKKRIEEKILELEKQKKSLSKRITGKDNKSEYGKNEKSQLRKNESSVDQLRAKDKTIRKTSSGKSSRKISHENASQEDTINKISLNDNKDNKIKKDKQPIDKKNFQSLRPSSGITSKIVKKQNKDFDDSLDEINEANDDNIDFSNDKNKLTKISEEINRMKNFLEKTQTEITKIEDKLTSKQYEYINTKENEASDEEAKETELKKLAKQEEDTNKVKIRINFFKQ